MNSYLKKDLYRYYGTYVNRWIPLFKSLELKYIYYLRKAQFSKSSFSKLYYRYKLKKLSEKSHIQIPYSTQIGEGFYIGHFGRIIINHSVKIGRNVNIAPGVTIGQENRGKRLGTPIIKNDVWIGINSVIVGKIVIGDDVLIAPNSFVNFDVPAHSIVIGNPAKIISKRNATDGYIDNKI